MKRKHASGVRFSQIPVMSRHASGNNGEVRGGQGSKGARAKRKRSCHARVKLFTRHILCAHSGYRLKGIPRWDVVLWVIGGRGGGQDIKRGLLCHAIGFVFTKCEIKLKAGILR